MNNKLPAQILLCILIGIAILVTPSIIEGGTPLIKLRPAFTLSGEISQTLGVNDDHKMPTLGHDFYIKAVQSFDNDTWRVATINTSAVKDDALVVFKKIDGNYVVQLGPGTSFSHESLKVLPTDVGNYLEQKGAVYVSS